MSTGDSEGPAWNKFWLSLDHETESMVSDGGSHHRSHQAPRSGLMTPDLSSRPTIDRGDSVQPNDSASHHGGDESHSDIQDMPSPPEDVPFPFKFKAPSGRVHRLQVIASAGMADLIEHVTAKLGGEVENVGGEATYEDGKIGTKGYALSYLDNEGDTVSITTDQDLMEAITLARRSHREKVDLFVHDPEKAPMAATVEPHPALPKPLTPPPSVIKERRRHFPADAEDEDGEDEMETPVKKERKSGKGKGLDRERVERGTGQEQFVPGVPNEVLLPAAIATLAVVIVGVFVMGRATSRN